MTYTIKALKTLSSGAYTCSLYEDGKRIAVIEDNGRGGQPDICPIKPENYGRERDRIANALTEWAQTNVPDWYLTGYGSFPALTPHWELAVGYLIECIENDRLVKPGRALYLRPDGAMVTAPATAPVPARGGYKKWSENNWVAA